MESIKKKLTELNNCAIMYEQSSYNIEAKKSILESMIKLTNSIQSDLKRKSSGMVVNGKSLYENTISDVVCRVEEKSDFLRITFDRLLPKREAKEDIPFITALSEELKKVSIKFDERIELSVIHHFKDKRDVKDYDNLESKRIIDILTLYVIKNDSPEYLSVRFDYVPDINEYSELILRPYKF